MATALPKQNTMDFKAMAIQCQQLKDNNGNAVDVTDLIAGSVTTATAAVVGAPATGFTAVSTKAGPVVTTTITVPATVFTVVGGATGVGELGTQIYDFPEGQIFLLGGYGTFTLLEASANITATAVVDVGVGTAAVGGGDDALGTDATDDDLLNAASLTLSSSTVTGNIISNSSAAKFDGTATPVDAFLNVSVQDAGIDNDSADITVSGTVVFQWILLGDD